MGGGNEGAAERQPQDDEERDDREEAGPPQDTEPQEHEGDGGQLPLALFVAVFSFHQYKLDFCTPHLLIFSLEFNTIN